MKKRKLFIIIAIIVICTAILVGIIFNRQPNVNIISNGDVSYYMIHDGYDEIDSKIISSYEEYKEFEKYMDEENKKYFYCKLQFLLCHNRQKNFILPNSY